MQVREPVVAGAFYPGSKTALNYEINILLQLSRTTLKLNKILGIIVPHAGYVYSGKTAAYAYSLLKDCPIKNVIIISPSHREFFNGCSISKADAFNTPLGIVPINTELRDELNSHSKNIILSDVGQKYEHAIEVQLPFLQAVLKDFSIVPIVMGHQSKEFIEDLAQAVEQILDDKTIIVVSTDLSHYYSKSEADKKDSRVEESIKSLNYEMLDSDIKHKKSEACGAGCILTLLKIANDLKYKKVEILNRTDSSETSMDESEVVGYLSAVIYE